MGKYTKLKHSDDLEYAPVRRQEATRPKLSVVKKEKRSDEEMVRMIAEAEIMHRIRAPRHYNMPKSTLEAMKADPETHIAAHMETVRRRRG